MVRAELDAWSDEAHSLPEGSTAQGPVDIRETRPLARNPPLSNRSQRCPLVVEQIGEQCVLLRTHPRSAPEGEN